MARKLIESEANVNARGEHNCTPMHLGARYGHLELVQLLVEHEANMNARDDLHRGPLHYAANFDRLEIEEFLLSKGAKYDAVDDEGTAPMLDGELLERHLEKKKPASLLAAMNSTERQRA